MRGCAGGSSQTGVRQVAVHVQKGRVVLTVADVRKQQPDHSPNKGVCEVTKTFILRYACVNFSHVGEEK